MRRLLLVLLLLCCCTYWSEGQEQSAKSGTDLIESLLKAENWTATEQAIEEHVQALTQASDFDSLALYTEYVARLGKGRDSLEAGIAEGDQFLASLKDLTDDPKVISQAHVSFSKFYRLINAYPAAFEQNELALEYALQIPNSPGATIGLIQSNLGVLAQRQGRAMQSITFHTQALQSYESDPNTKLDQYVIVYNSLGGSMWYTSNLDSAMYYYRKGLETLDRMESTPRNQFYRPALIQGNMAGILRNEGRITEAIDTMLTSIQNVDAFLDSDPEALFISESIRLKLTSIDNLASLYQMVGDYERGLDLLQYSYEEKQKHLPPDAPTLFKSLVVLGRIHMVMRNFDEAQIHLDSALNFMAGIPGNFPFWEGDCHNYLGEVCWELGQIDKARYHYDRAEQIYNATFQGYYDDITLTFTNNASSFNAENGDPERGIDQAQKALDFVIGKQGDRSLQAFRQTVALANVYAIAEDHQKAYDLAVKALSIIEQPTMARTSLLDSLLVEFEKPSILLVKAKSEYALGSNKDIPFLKGLYEDLAEAIDLLEKRRSTSAELGNLTTLVEVNKGLFSFAKKITAELYEKTGEAIYIDELASLHESGLYNRIRLRLTQQESIKYSGIPYEVRAREKQLNQNIDEALNLPSESVGQNFDQFMIAKAAKEAFLDTLKHQYPEYFRMRYATIITPLGDLQQQVPDSTTVVRYIFVENDLYALVITSDLQKMVALDGGPVRTELQELKIRTEDWTKLSGQYHTLYQLLWAPIEDVVQTLNVIVIPDQELYNLSFDLLTPSLSADVQTLAKDCLINRHAIAYNYSLALIGRTAKELNFDNNFVGFSPEFSDDMKTAYQQKLKDSLNLDRQYLYLLPQPFSKKLSENMKRLFGGESFVQDASTKSAFIRNAGKNRIIFLGTHAASDNLNPERSRLIFAKDETLDPQTNYLYAYEIYECDLQSRLTILSGCETGKPGYQPGEGMISLAHAFDYVGSESLLTALWKIDEQSSSTIIEQFLKNLKDGMAKSEALRQAKLTYLSSATNRAALPEYWAGLVLMGDTDPMEFPEDNSRWYWILALMAAVGVGIYWRVRTTDRP
ncbi:MAG: CHAT domain-containing tetratricopeptide repeat protein [Bacteroidota bacterium]